MTSSCHPPSLYLNYLSSIIMEDNDFVSILPTIQLSELTPEREWVKVAHGGQGYVCRARWRTKTRSSWLPGSSSSYKVSEDSVAVKVFYQEGIQRKVEAYEKIGRSP
eukprot:TRINITY_DN12899_c0_g1_i2.p2 TRINITY_DN12899_c0_g1~~TRINITY_DN12899_c0_g1_i2.p2  ORF type:complete len:107 (+),score=35.84 TRINITY_DN12899_c0_g1_i2:206-526(+)